MNTEIVVNVFGGPGVGKSTLSAQLYAYLKTEHRDVEYVNEFAKELVYENNLDALEDQVYIFGTQLHRLRGAVQHNQIVICDSPLLLSAIYNSDTSPHLIDLVLDMHRQFNNINIFLKRSTYPYSMKGRVHSLTQSISIDNQILHFFKEHSIHHTVFDPSIETYQTLLPYIIP